VPNRLSSCCILQQQDHTQTHKNSCNHAAADADCRTRGHCSGSGPVGPQRSTHGQRWRVVPENRLRSWWWGRWGRELHVLAPTPSTEEDTVSHDLSANICQHDLECVICVVADCEVQRGLAVQLQTQERHVRGAVSARCLTLFAQPASGCRMQLTLRRGKRTYSRHKTTAGKDASQE
jgi:hypothetical protein